MRDRAASSLRLIFFGLIHFVYGIAVAAGTFGSPGSPGITYQGRIIKPNGAPLQSSGVEFKIKILTPGPETCVLYEESQTIDLTSSSGIFAITLNDGNGTRTDASGYSLDQVFANRAPLTFAPGACAPNGATTWSPGLSDGRKFAVSFRDPNMTSFEPMPIQNLSFIPLAIEAKQISGFTAKN